MTDDAKSASPLNTAYAAMRDVAERASLNAGNAYDEMMRAWKYPSWEHAEAKGAQGNLQLAIAVLVAERNLARAENALLAAKLCLARHTLDQVAHNEGTASQVVEEVKEMRKARR